MIKNKSMENIEMLEIRDMLQLKLMSVEISVLEVEIQVLLTKYNYYILLEEKKMYM